ncbi:helix-turn-helix domain-containing protein [Streptomyces sp. NPDC005012]|uniref:helix-turn-helix domain-containing protein n=1 Tax=Streptomyces sp. NPDC005012 TaxID=3154558 RepID=UPI0033B54E14
MTGRDRLRELLDAVLDEDNRTLGEMARDAFVSPYHFNRTLSRAAGEAPVAMRRRVLLERAAWRLAQGRSVTEAAWEAGYESVEGFGRAFLRAFGRPPSSVEEGTGHWLPAPNGIHFHPPTSLWVSATEHTMNPLTEQLVAHDLDDTRYLLERAKGLPEEEFRARRLPGLTVQEWFGPEESVQALLEHHVHSLESWLASIEGRDLPDRDPEAGAAALLERHDAVAPRWLAAVRDIDRRGGWDDRLIDALCDPPESFLLSGVVAHVLTYAAHRRQLVRHLMRTAGCPVDAGDPITWLRTRRGETSDGDA